MAEKTPSSVRPTRFSRAMDRLYRYNYGVGLRTARLGRRIWRWLFPRLTAVGGWLWRRWQVLVVRPFRRQHRKLGRMYAAFPTAWRELAAAWKKKPLSLFPCLGGLIKRAARRYREEWLILWRLAGPVAAVLVFAVTVAAWSHTNFCLALQYRGEKLGYIESETTYSEAAAMAVARVMNVDNSFEVEAAPTLAVTVQGRHDTLSDTELCDAILRTAGDSIAESTGLYVDETFVGAAESAAELETVLQSIQDGYYDKTDSNQRAEFVQTVDMVEGLFPSQSVVSADELKSRLTSEAVVKKTYVVQPGDTLSTIAVKNDMTLSALRAMNPSYASTDMVHIGDELLIQRPQPFLQVKVIKTITYAQTLNYNTVYENNTSQPVTYSKIKVKGEEGSQTVVAEVTYVDGLETGRRILSTTVTKQPVTKVVERGTQAVKSSSGSTVVIGDGVATGTMLWPVPICHNMSRGFSGGHGGLDICNGPVSVRNKPAVAADGGTVVYAGWYYGYGNYVKIQHANGLCTAYGHLNSISVVKGQAVSRGQQVGLIGSTGQSSGPHLHFEVIRNGARVNPLNYVRP